MNNESWRLHLSTANDHPPRQLAGHAAGGQRDEGG
jgi:hypothetical protein